MCVDQIGFIAVKDFLRSGSHKQIITIVAPKALDYLDYACEKTPTEVRLVRNVTPNDRVYVVMTSLLDGITYPASDFYAFNHSRWRIEEAFKRLKHRVALESSSCLSWFAAQH